MDNCGIQCTAVLVILSLLSLSLCDKEWSSLPCRTPWFVNSSIKTTGADGCECSQTPLDFQAVRCDNASRTVSLLLTYCMTFNNSGSSGLTVLGSCPDFPTSHYIKGYIQLPDDISELNEFMCAERNRKGVLCSECVEGYTPGPLSYNHQCVQCNGTSGITLWIAFFCQQFVPVTIFFFAVLVLRLKMTTQPAYILFAQVYSGASTVKLIHTIATQTGDGNNSAFHSYEKFLISVYGIWNLDFFRLYLTHLCLGDANNLSTLDTVALEYLAPLYVMLLIAASYILIKLHDRGCPAVVTLWRPFAVFFYYFRQQWNLSESVIHTVAAFTLLSYTKLLVVSFEILNSSVVYKSTSTEVDVVPYYAANLKYFSGRHATYGTIAVFIIIILCIPPLVLLFYPLRAFQVFLNRCLPTRLREALRIFVECHQGHLRNGADGGWDCRYIAAWYFILRIIILVAAIDNPFSIHFGGQSVTAVIFITAIVFALLRPYTKLYLTVTDTLLLVLLSIIYWLLINAMYLVLLDTPHYMPPVIAILSTLPLLWWVGSVGCMLLWKRRLLISVYRRTRAYISMDSDTRTPLTRNLRHNDLTDSFAHRVSSPDAYNSQSSSQSGRPKPMHSSTC